MSSKKPRMFAGKGIWTSALFGGWAEWTKAIFYCTGWNWPFHLLGHSWLVGLSLGQDECSYPTQKKQNSCEQELPFSSSLANMGLDYPCIETHKHYKILRFKAGIFLQRLFKLLKKVRKLIMRWWSNTEHVLCCSPLCTPVCLPQSS